MASGRRETVVGKHSNYFHASSCQVADACNGIREKKETLQQSCEHHMSPLIHIKKI